MNLIEKYQEKFSKEGVAFSYWTKNTNFPYQAKLVFPSGNTLGLKGRKSKGVFYLHPLENTDFKKATEDEMKHLKKLIHFFECFAEEKEQPNMFVYRYDFLLLIPEKLLEEMFPKEKYDEISPQVAYTLQKKGELVVSALGWVNIGKDKRIYSFSKMCKVLHEFMRSYEKKEITFTIGLPEIGRRDIVNYHFMGHNGKVELVLTLEGKVIIYDERLAFSLKTELENLEEGLEKLIESIQKKRKVKMIFEPSKHYFYQIARETMPMFFNGFVNKIYEILKVKYGPNVLEEHCAESLKKYNFFSFGESGYQIFTVGKDLFVVKAEKEEIVLHTEYDKHEEAFSFYKEKCLEEVTENLNKQERIIKLRTSKK